MNNRYRLSHAMTDQSGGALILALLVSMVVFGVGAMALTMSRSEMRVSANHLRGLSAKYFAESDLQRAVGNQNDLTQSPRFLFNPANYSYRATGPNDTSVFVAAPANLPLTSGIQQAGSVVIRVAGKDPVTQSPPYDVVSTATLNDGSRATYAATLDVVSLLDFAVFSDDDIFIAPNITISGRTYSGDDITLTGPIATFLQRVEYAGSLQNQSNGLFLQGYGRIPPLPSIPSLVNMNFFRNASQNAGVCGAGRGLYVGTAGGALVDAQTTALFTATLYNSLLGLPGVSSGGSAGRCRDVNNCYLIDFTLFDFTASPITYNGVPVLAFDGTPLTDFNGVIWADREVHVFGHLGGRSVEDGTVIDTQDYMTPPSVLRNAYSNHRLDAGEDGSNGGVSDNQLDWRGRGTSLGIYGSGNIYIDHNIWAGTDALGIPVRLALVATNNVHIDRIAPKAITVEAAVLAVNGTWDPEGGSSHRDNLWAENGGTSGQYRFDLDRDGNIAGAVENNMRNDWTLYNLGNLVVSGRPNSGTWASNGYPRFYTYDTQLQTTEIPCYPTLPNYEIVPGSFSEVLNVP